MTPSEQQIAKQKLRREFAERIARLSGPAYVPTPHHVQAIDSLMDEWMNAYLDLVVMIYRDKPKIREHPGTGLPNHPEAYYK